MLADTMASKRPHFLVEEVGVADTHKRQMIVRMLTESGNDDLSHLLVIPIIVVPGTEKATLSQCVYHDARICEYFDVRHWVSMSDIDEGPNKMLNLVFRRRTNDADILEEFHSIVDGKRYLLILDGVTHRDHAGVFLHDLLSNVSEGSKIILSATNLAALRNIKPLQVLDAIRFHVGYYSVDKAWSLFESMAFNDGEEKDYANQIKSDIGFETCRKYASLPRLIEKSATILENSENWEYIHDIKLYSSKEPSEIKLSNLNLACYKDLPSNLQQCINYCSLFPEGYEFTKADLLHLWDPQQYLSARNTNPEGLDGDEYVGDLQNNGYLFVGNGNYSDNVIIRYNIDSLTSKFLKSVAKPEFCLVYEDIGETDRANILHLSFPVVESTWEAPSWLPDAKQLRTLLFLPSKAARAIVLRNIDAVLSSLRQLRSLDLAALNCENLPVSLGELVHLRYLRLGVTSEYLPQSITSLTNLQTLDLRLSSVAMLPKGFHKLVCLKHLYTGDRLMDMPPDFGQLTSLETLDVFIVGKNNSIDALSQLKGLVGKLKVRYNHHDASDQANEGADEILKDTYLTHLTLIWSSSYEGTDRDVFECPQPPPSVKSISLCHWTGAKFPQQLTNSFHFLRSLVSLYIEDCNSCQYLPAALSTLPNLKSLQVWNLSGLEYMETDANSNWSFFPSLEFLMLANLPKLNRLSSYFPKLQLWSAESQEWNVKHQRGASEKDSYQIFPSLLEFRVSGCPDLKSMPQMPKLESLEAHFVSVDLLNYIQPFYTLKTLILVSIDKLNSFSISPGLESLTIRRCPELATLHSKSSVLKELEVHECARLEGITLTPFMQHIMLEKLTLKRCEAFHRWDINQGSNHDEQSDGGWEKLQLLRYLKLINNSKLEALPIGLSYLKKLEELSLHSLYILRSLPEWIGNIPQLRRLAIRNCPLLTTLPESLGTLSNLQELEVHNCMRLKDIPASILQSLKRLDIQNCPKLQSSHQQDG